MSTMISASAWRPASRAARSSFESRACRKASATAAIASSSWRRVTVWVWPPSRRRADSARVISRASATPSRRRCAASGRSSPFPARVRQRDQVPGQIAAVDGGYVSRVERAQIARVVPIVEMSAEALQPAHRRERRLEPIDRPVGSDPAEIARADDGKEIEAEIGRRRPMRDRRRRIVLKIVGRQHVVGRRDEGLEEPPGAARGSPERLGVGVGHRQLSGRSRRQTDAARDGRRGDPQRGERKRHRPRSVAERQSDNRCDGADERSPPPFGASSPGGRDEDRSSPAPPEPIRADGAGSRPGARACGRSHRPSATPDPPGTRRSASTASRRGGNRRRAPANGSRSSRPGAAAEWRRRPG